MLFWLSDRTGRKINGEFLTEYTDLIDSIARYGAGEDSGVTEEDLVKECCRMKAGTLRAAAWILLVVSLLACSVQAAGQTEASKISNDRVVVHFPDDVDVPLDVQKAFLEGVTDSIRYVEEFFGSPLPKPVQYVFTEGGGFYAHTKARPPYEIIDERGVPTTIEETQYRCVRVVTHELVHLHSYGTWGEHSFLSMSEGFAELVSMLRAEHPLHDVAAAEHEMGRLPPLRALLAEGFASESKRLRYLYSCMPSFLGFVYEGFGHDVLIHMYNNIPPYTAGAITEKLFALIEDSTTTPLDELELRWREMLNAIEVSERFIAVTELTNELLDVGLNRLYTLSDHLGVEIDLAFREELQSILTDIDRYGWGEPVCRDELSGRIRRLSERADEMCSAMLGTSE